MKRNNHNYGRLALLLLLFMAASWQSCKKEFTAEQVRLFRPVLKTDLLSEGNWIQANWQAIKGASGYLLQLSRDTFKTIDQSISTDTNFVRINDLAWDKLYQLRLKALAPDTIYNSGFANLGSVKTPKFPSILRTPTLADIASTQVRLSWTADANPVTAIKVYLAADSSLVREIALTNEDRANQYRIVRNLLAATPYILYLYSGTTIRGWENVTTKEPLVGNLVDLSEITDRPNILMDTLPLIPNGSTVLLSKGATYLVNKTLALNKSVTITSNDDLAVTEPAALHFTSNFTFEANASVDYVRFINLKMRSDNYASRYVFNVNSPCNVGEISYESCVMGAFRGVTRFQNQAATVGMFKVNNCVVDSVKDYGLGNADGANCLIQNFSLTNSTFYKMERIIVSTKPTGRAMNSILVENCTFNEAPWGGIGEAGIGGSIIDCANMTFVMPITFKNNIIGPGMKRDNTIVRGIRPGGGSIDASGNFGTSDYLGTNDPIPNIVIFAKPSTDLFTNPAIGDFKIKDMSFPGRNIAGDPRWRP